MKNLAYVAAVAILALAGCGPKQQPAQSSGQNSGQNSPPAQAAANPPNAKVEWEVLESVGDYASASLAWDGDIVSMEPADMTAGQVRFHFRDSSGTKFPQLSELVFQRVDKPDMIPAIPSGWTTISAKALGELVQSIIKDNNYDYYCATGTLSDKNGGVHPVLALFVPAETQGKREFALVIVNLEQQHAAVSTDIGIVQGGVIHGPGH